ncbi:MAG TPA: hypothetical protein VK179_13895 [Bacteroidales bacterium]|nr:hypothetical protein [Bacteroidales bacterium]
MKTKREKIEKLSGEIAKQITEYQSDARKRMLIADMVWWSLLSEKLLKLNSAIEKYIQK